MPDFVAVLSDLGGTLGSLLACFFYIFSLQKSYQVERDGYRQERDELRKEALEERTRWVTKDSEADIRMIELQQSSYQSLMTVMQETAKVLQDLHSSINELKIMIGDNKSNGK
jgi:hypothetical protein